MTAISSVQARSTEPPDAFWAFPIPDSRPAAVRWHRAPETGPRMSALPLDVEDSGVGAGGPAVGTPPDGLEGLRTHARSLLSALVDAIQGRRPTAQLTRWVSDDVMADLVLRARLHQRTPLPLAVRSVRVQVQDSTVVEVSGRLQAGDRFTAAALRLERVGARWFCPVADFGPLAHAGDHPLPRVRAARAGTQAVQAPQDRSQRRV